MATARPGWWYWIACRRIVRTGTQRADIPALAAVFLVASLSAGAGAGADGAGNLDAAARCDVIVCSYVTKTVICHRLARACADRPSPRPFQPHPHKPQ
jgi:hypothetical protein